MNFKQIVNFKEIRALLFLSLFSSYLFETLKPIYHELAMHHMASLVVQLVKNLPAMQET